MKAKTSLTLSEDLLATLDRMAGAKVSRSSFIEKILREFVLQRTHQRRELKEMTVINQHAAQLNAQMADALEFQKGMD